MVSTHNGGSIGEFLVGNRGDIADTRVLKVRVSGTPVTLVTSLVS